MLDSRAGNLQAPGFSESACAAWILRLPVYVSDGSELCASDCSVAALRAARAVSSRQAGVCGWRLCDVCRRTPPRSASVIAFLLPSSYPFPGLPDSEYERLLLRRPRFTPLNYWPMECGRRINTLYVPPEPVPTLSLFIVIELVLLIPNVKFVAKLESDAPPSAL